MTTSVIHPDVARAYAETDYHVSALSPFVLKVGQHCPELQASFAQMEADCAVFITPSNPFSQILSNSENLLRQQGLAGELSARKLKFLTAVGKHPHSDWPGEAGFLVFGLTLAQASELGVRWQQNAIVYCDADALPRLILLR